jgi:hypothetical protein
VRPLVCILVLAVSAGTPPRPPERVLDGRREPDAAERRAGPSAPLRSVLNVDGGIASVAFLPDGGARFHVLIHTLEWRLGDDIEPPYVQGPVKKDHP